MAATKRKARKPKLPNLTEVTLTGLIGGEITVETSDDLWNWAGDTDGYPPGGVALHVTGAHRLREGKEGEVAALSMGDLDNLIEELTKARDIMRARIGGAK